MNLYRLVFISGLYCMSTVCLYSSETPILPHLLADFPEQQPVLTIAPGEKRLGRAPFPGSPYNKHPYNAFSGRKSLKDIFEKDEEGRTVLTPSTSMVADVQGAFNPAEGTLSGWFRTGNGSKGRVYLSIRNGFLESVVSGKACWELGEKEDGRIYLKTETGECESKEALDAGWHYLTAIWSVDAGVRIFLNGELIAESWSISDESEKEWRLFDADDDQGFLGKAVFSQGTGKRQFIPLVNVSEPSVSFSAGEPLRMEVTDNERRQIRAENLCKLPSGRYELFLEATSGKDGANIAPRIGLKKGTESRYARLTPSGENRYLFEVEHQDSGSDVALDLNLLGPGVFEIRAMSIRLALGASDGQELLGGDQLAIHEIEEGGIRDLRLYEVALSPRNIQALYQGNMPEKGAQEKLPFAKAQRISTFGWNNAPEDTYPSAQAGHRLRFRQATILEAKENYRAAGWLAVGGMLGEKFPWSYHGYQQGMKQMLNLELALTPNWMAGSASSFKGALKDSSGTVDFEKNSGWFQSALRVAGKELSFVQEEGALSQLAFYQVSEELTDPSNPHAESFLRIRKAEGLPGGRRDFFSGYREGDRLVLEESNTGSTDEPLTLAALRTWHIASAPVAQEYALDGLVLRLGLSPLVKPTRARLVVHDPSSARRELARVDILLQPAPTGNYTIELDLRDTLLLSGQHAWVSITLEEDAILHTGKGGTSLILQPAADREHAAVLWKEWEKRYARDRFEALSEPRPWLGDDGSALWWLRVTSPAFKEMEDALLRLRTKFPEDETVRAWYAFTHPASGMPLNVVPLPKADGHPEWAVLLRECLLQYRTFVDYWIDQRQAANGEFGHFYGDDTDLVQDWLDLILTIDRTGKYRTSLDRLAYAIANTFVLRGGRNGPNGAGVKGQSILKNGLNRRWTDVLHAYEEGLNVQPADFIAHYGDPERFQRLLDTVQHYDGRILTAPSSDGTRGFPSQGSSEAFLNSDHLLGGMPGYRYWPLMLHVGIVVGWYNNDPAVWEMLEAVARRMQQKGYPVPSGVETVLQAVYIKTRNPDYLIPMIDATKWKEKKVMASPMLNANQYLRLTELDRAATARHLAVDWENSFDSYKSQTLGWADQRHLHGWVQWKLTGDEEALLTALRGLYRELAFLMPARTVAEQSGDRVSLPKQLISQLYLGGVPGSRNRHFMPDFAVSYQGFGDDFAARVEESTEKHVRIRFYSFATKESTGAVRFWALKSGAYKVSIADSKGEGEEQRYILRRGETIPLTLPPEEELLLSVVQVEQMEEKGLLPDAAVSPKFIQFEGNTLKATVFNLGVVAQEDVNVVLKDKEGRILDEHTIKMLPAMRHWQLGKFEVVFENPSPKAALIEIRGKEGDQEITLSNNFSSLPTEVIAQP